MATLLATLVALGLGLAACGGGSPKAPANSPSATLPSGCSSSGCSNSGSSQRLEAEALTYSACMRSHGVSDFPDPTVASNGLPSWSINASPNSDLDPNSPQNKRAHEACSQDLPTLGPHTPAETTAAIAEAVKYAECMRSHGEPDFPDPNGKAVIQIKNATGILDPSSLQYERAQTACQSLDKGFAEQFAGSREHPPASAGSSP